MGYRTFKQRTPPPLVANAPPKLRRIAADHQWSFTEYVCSAGPHDRTYEERHDRVSIALVTRGTFRYRTDTGEGVLYPGAFLLGNAGSCYECGHAHSHGDHCLALHIERELFAEIAATPTGNCRFRTPILPAVSDVASASVSLQLASLPQPNLALEEAILTAIATVARVVGTHQPRACRPRAAASRKVTAAMDYIESRLADDLSLAELCVYVGMSKYHFLRTFKQESGMTPHQYILGRRLRTAAAALRATQDPVSQIALDQGFGDLSTFNHHFRRVMGVTPTTYRGSPSRSRAAPRSDPPR